MVFCDGNAYSKPGNSSRKEQTSSYQLVLLTVSYYLPPLKFQFYSSSNRGIYPRKDAPFRIRRLSPVPCVSFPRGYAAAPDTHIYSQSSSEYRSNNPSQAPLGWRKDQRSKKHVSQACIPHDPKAAAHSRCGANRNPSQVDRVHVTVDRAGRDFEHPCPLLCADPFFFREYHNQTDKSVCPHPTAACPNSFFIVDYCHTIVSDRIVQ